MNYAECVRFLYSLGNEVKAAKLGLDRIETLLEALGSPHRSGRFVHVAGTNGKGSTCAMIEAALREAGFRTGLYTSPHLAEPPERIRAGGEPVSRERFAEAFARVHAAAEKLLAAGAIEAHPTYFETVTAMGFLLFRDLGAEISVVEVGLGGRLDATNVIVPEVAVITPVDYDHEAFLGKSLESIAAEKAGILKPGVPAVFARQRREAAQVLEQRAAELGIDVERAGEWPVSDFEIDALGCRFTARRGRALRIECPLAGEHQAENALTAAAALVRLGIPDEAIERGIARTRWPGRLELVRRAPDVFLDGAHNPAGARALAAYIRRFHAGRRVVLIYGAMRDKAVEEVAGILAPVAGEIILTAPRQPRAVRPEAMRALVDHPSVRIAPSLAEALAVVDSAGADKAVFVTGSLFLVGEARALLVS